MMTINDKIKDEKLEYKINSEAAKISALLSGKLDMDFVQAKIYYHLIKVE